MNKRTRLITGGAVVAAVIGTGVGVGLASGGDDQPLQGSAYDRATQAALDHVGGGTVLETETGDGGAAYEVEIRTPDGGVVEVQLDENFTAYGSEADDDGAGEDEGADDDD
jgi:hypothetical protein